jgi:Zn-dependent protease with chaperone function
MERADFIRLVEKCERQAEASPGWFRTQLRLFMSLATVYLVFLLIVGLLGGALCAAMLFGVFYTGGKGAGGLFWMLILIGVPSILLVWGTIRAFLVRITPAPGKLLSPSDFPVLHQEVAEICRMLNAPPVHRIVLNEEVGYAAVGTAPSRWVFGKLINTLVLAPFLLTTHSRDDVKAIITHEVGHVLGGDTHLTMKLSALIERWDAVYASISREGKERLKLVSRFLRWYTPRLEARRLVLSRAQEILADKRICQLGHTTLAASALLATELKGRAFKEVFRKHMDKLVAESETPPAGYYQMMRAILNDPQTYEKADAWLAEELRRPTDYGDTHPALRDRLAAILGREGLGPEELRQRGCWPDLTRADAAEVYLGGELDVVLAEFNAQWIDNVREGWAAFRSGREEDQKQLREIEERLSQSTASIDDRIDRALILERTGEEESAVAAISQLIEHDPKCQSAHYIRGRMLLQQGNREGIHDLAESMRLDPRSRPGAYDLLRDYHLRMGSKDAAHDAEKRMDDALKLAYESEQERSALTHKDILLPPVLDADKVEAIRNGLWNHKKVSRAWLVCKKVKIYPEYPCHLVIIEYDAGLFPGGNTLQRAVDQIAASLPLPEDTLCWINPFTWTNGIKRRVRRAAGAPFYDRRKMKKLVEEGLVSGGSQGAVSSG